MKLVTNHKYISGRQWDSADCIVYDAVTEDVYQLAFDQIEEFVSMSLDHSIANHVWEVVYEKLK